MVESQDQTVTLNSGYKMPVIGLGTWEQFNQESITVGLIEVGYRHLDCAMIYKNEELVGNALKAAIEKGLKREDVFITTKLWLSDYVNPEAAIQESLRKLQVDYVDLYILHWPAGYWNGKVPLHVLWPKMEALVEQKLTRSIGVSNFNIQLTADLLTYAKILPAVNQVELHPLNPQTELVRFHKELGIVSVGYCPVAKAGATTFVTGKSSTATAPNLQEDADIKEIAAKYNKSPLQTILRWGLERGHVIIPKATSKVHLEENFNVFDFTLTEEEVNRITEKGQGLRICNKFSLLGNFDIFA